LIAPRHDMIHGVTIFEAQRSSHAAILPQPRSKIHLNYQVPRPDPFMTLSRSMSGQITVDVFPVREIDVVIVFGSTEGICVIVCIHD